jgi:UDP-2,3-diacylglucosamine pyrophosphatase LpxH
MQTFITSDLHLGVPQCRAEAFLSFLKSLPDGARLVLNGDIITHYHNDKTLKGIQSEVLKAIVAASYEREVVWARGNNDRKLQFQDQGKIQFVDEYAIGKRLYIAHGHQFDRLMPTVRILLVPSRVLYDAVARLLGSETHVAQFAKRLNGLYRLLCRHVTGNAVTYAKRHGYAAVTCGHTHYAEDLDIDGVRYLNTGCWTENQAAIVVVDDDGFEYRHWDGGC